MTLLPLSHRLPLGLAALAALAGANSRIRAVWHTMTSRLRGRLRPLEWILLIVGTLALLAFVYVLWRQPVSRR